MGIAPTYGEAFAKSQICANSALPVSGKVFVSVKDEDKRSIVLIAKRFRDFGFELVSTPGTAKVLRANGIKVQIVGRYDQGQQEGINLMPLIKNAEIKLIVNTPSGESSQYDMRAIRAAAILHNVPCITTLQGAWAAVNAMETKAHERKFVQSLQDYYKTQKDPSCAVL